MPKNKIYEFSVPMGDRFPLLIDTSMKQLEEYLNRELETNISRKLIYRALSDLYPDSEKSLLQEEIELQRSTKFSENTDKDTRPLGLCWDSRDLIKALAVTRKELRGKTGEDLAEHTIARLSATLHTQTPDDLKDSHVSLRLLQEPSIQQHLISHYQTEVNARLARISDLLDPTAADINSETKMLKMTIPILDGLLLKLEQEHTYQSSKNGTDSVTILETLYHNLMSSRPNLVGNNESSKYVFQLSDHDDLMKRLQKGLCQNNQKISDDQRTQLREDYQKYLLHHAEEFDQEKILSVRSFISQYADIYNYFKTTETWETLARTMREELLSYVSDVFRETQTADIVPYKYSTYSSSATGAFIAELTINAHDQIRANLHNALYLMRSVTSAMYFFFDKSYKNHLDDPDLLPNWPQAAMIEIQRLANQFLQYRGPVFEKDGISTSFSNFFLSKYNPYPINSRKEKNVCPTTEEVHHTIANIQDTAGFKKTASLKIILSAASCLAAQCMIESAIRETEAQYKILKSPMLLESTE